MLSHQKPTGYGGIRKRAVQSAWDTCVPGVAGGVAPVRSDSGFCQLRADEGLGMVVG